MTFLKSDLSSYEDKIGFKEKSKRFLFTLTWLLLARPIPRRMCNGWKLMLLRLFGATVHKNAVVYSSAKIYMPWNLEMGKYSCLASETDCYNPAPISIGAHTTISQKSYLCSATHDITRSNHLLVLAPITIEDQVWVAADSFIGPGVTVGQGAVVGARSAVFKDVDPWTVVGGNPAQFIKKREIKDSEDEA